MRWKDLQEGTGALPEGGTMVWLRLREERNGSEARNGSVGVPKW